MQYVHVYRLNILYTYLKNYKYIGEGKQKVIKTRWKEGREEEKNNQGKWKNRNKNIQSIGYSTNKVMKQ